MPPPGNTTGPCRVRLPDTATHAMLIDELWNTDGPHIDYADVWVTYQTGQFVPPMAALRQVRSAG